MKLKLAVLGGLLLAGANAMACYTVYDGNARVLYQGLNAPVDMSLPLHEALSQRGFPRAAQMVFDQNATCRPVGVAEVPRPSVGDVPPNTIRLERASNTRPSSSSPAPLFTDRQTAERARLPHTQVAGDIVVVPAQVAERAMHAAVTVLPASTFAGAAPIAPDTTMLGAGPARMSANRPAPTTAKPNVVITEMRDPPVTIIEGGGGVTINRY